MGIGIPFSIALYSLLIRLIALVCDLDVSEAISERVAFFVAWLFRSIDFAYFHFRYN
jgi:hypothetical protein